MPLNSRINLDAIDFRPGQVGGIVVQERAQPYIWTVFFKIDDADRTGQPVATVVGTPGSHGNLGVDSVRAPSSIAVPARVGRWETTLRELPPAPGTVNALVGAVVGVVAVLMEEDNVTDDGAEAGRRELLVQVRQVIEGIAANLVSALSFDEEAFAALRVHVWVNSGRAGRWSSRRGGVWSGR